MGRVLNLRTTLGNRQFDAVYCYNFVGGITQVDYPDTHPWPGFVWEYEYDGQNGEGDSLLQVGQGRQKGTRERTREKGTVMRRRAVCLMPWDEC